MFSDRLVFLSIYNCIKQSTMSVSKHFESHYKDRQHHPYQQLLKNVLSRLDAIESRHNKPFITTTFNGGVSSEEIDKLKVNMKVVLNSSIENLKRLEESTRDNWEEIIDKLGALETKMLRILKQKEEVMQFLEFRVVSIESSQKNVTEFMKKVAEQQNLKYSGVPLIQERIKQIQHIFELKDQRQSESLRILEENTKLQTDRKFKQLEAKISEKMENQVKQEQSETNNEQRFEEIADKLKLFDLQNKEMKRKISKMEENLKQVEDEISSLSKKTDTLQKQLKNFQKSQVSYSVQPISGGLKTENAERNLKKVETAGHQTVSKKTQPNFLKPEPPSNNRNSQMESRKNPYDLLNNKNKLETNNHFERNRKDSYQEEADQDPFENMGAGIRGLLRKSKQKDEKKPMPNRQLESNRRPLPRQSKLAELSRESSPRGGLRNRNLPPVKPDQKLQNRFSNKNSQITSEQEEQVYQVDQEGYLIDEDGNYLYDDEGNRIQLSEEQMDKLLEQN